ncbi:MAG: cell division protein FtsQ/DivIB [Ottowia sp.]|nr:cell division protein FtsQ/DivIB [Ottowia sp.]
MIWHNPLVLNRLAAGFATAACVMLLGAGIHAFIHLPYFELRNMVIDETEQLPRHIDMVSVHAYLASVARGNFFTADLASVRHTLQTLPWVRDARVRRVWPDGLAITLEEHVPMAIWGMPGSGRLVNAQGEVFSAPLGSELRQLIRLNGPEGRSSEMLARWLQIKTIFSPLHWELDALNLNARYAWSAHFQNGMKVEFGRQENETHQPSLEVRAQYFVASWPAVSKHWNVPIDYADLRYTNGFAVRTQSVANHHSPMQLMH